MSRQTSVYPAAGMTDLGCQLVGLHLFTPFVDWTASVPSQIQADVLVEIHGLSVNVSPYLETEIVIPMGHKVLRS